MKKNRLQRKYRIILLSLLLSLSGFFTLSVIFGFTVGFLSFLILFCTAYIGAELEELKDYIRGL